MYREKGTQESPINLNKSVKFLNVGSHDEETRREHPNAHPAA